MLVMMYRVYKSIQANEKFSFKSFIQFAVATIKHSKI
jgi:hypothetical protein